MTLIPGKKPGVDVRTLDGFPENQTQFLRADRTFATPAGGGGGGTGDVVGPASAVNNHVVAFNGATGKLVKDAGVLVADVVVTTDSRMTNARTPTAHTHPEADVVNLVSDLAALSAGVAAAEQLAHKNAASGYAGLDGSSKLTGSQQKYGSAANTACEGNDTRLADARTPTAHTHPESDVTNLVTDLAARKLTDQATSNTGTQNNFNLGARMTYLRCDGAAPVFTGFTVLGSAPVAGDFVLLQNTGTGTLRVAKNDGGSTAANQITAPSARGQIVGVGGAVLLVYDGTASRWRVDAVASGAAIPVAFNAGDFTGNGTITWTVDAGDVSGFSYRQDGTLLYVFLAVVSSTFGGTASSHVQVALPNGFTIANGGVQVGSFTRIVSPGVSAPWKPGLFATVPAASGGSDTQFRLGYVDGGNLALSTNDAHLQGTAIMTVD